MPTSREKKRAYDAEYRRQNRERLQAFNRDYYRANAERIRAYMRDYRRKHPRKAKSAVLKALWGISLDDYERMLADQNGGCAICGTPPTTRRLCIDHNHKTGAVRGLLCDDCNFGLGFFRESAERMISAIQYLAKYAPA